MKADSCRFFLFNEKGNLVTTRLATAATRDPRFQFLTCEMKVLVAFFR